MTGQENTQNGNLDSWDNFTGSNFLGVDDVKSENDAFVCVNVEYDRENDRPITVLERDGTKKKFSLNVTNSNFVKDKGINTPRDLIGKKVYFRKTMAFSPTAKKEVQTLRIEKVE